MGAAIGVGIIGAGAMGRAYAECLRRHTSGATLVGIAGGQRAEALARDYETICLPSVEALMTKPDLHAVIIASPETAHCAQTLLAAASGKHVLVEKPMAPDLAQCDTMIAACARAGVRLMVVKHWRFRSVHLRARALLNEGRLGAIESIENHTHSTLAASRELVGRKPFYVDPAGGGLLMGWAVHNLDWVRFLAEDEPVGVTAIEAERTDAQVGPTHLAAEIRFRRGAIGRVCVSIDGEAVAPSDIFRTRVQTQNARLDLDGYGKLQLEREGRWQTAWTQPAFDPRNATDPLRLEAYAAMIQGFIDSIRQEATPPITGNDGRMAVALFLAAREAARARTMVRL